MSGVNQGVGLCGMELMRVTGEDQCLGCLGGLRRLWDGSGVMEGVMVMETEITGDGLIAGLASLGGVGVKPGGITVSTSPSEGGVALSAG